MAEMTARYKPGENVPVFAGAQISAGRFVKVTGAKTVNGDYPAAHCGAGEAAFGVAEQDSAPTTYPAHSTDRRVNVARAGAIARVTAGAAITFGADVQSNATGKAVTRTTGLALGKCLVAASADTDTIEVELYGAPTGGVTAEGAASIGVAVADVGALTATNPSAVVAAAGEVTAADLTTTQGVETAVSALVVDVAAQRTTLNALLASLRTAGHIAT